MLLGLLTLGMRQAGADAGNLQITPTAGLEASGFVLGPFAPSSKVYTLKNVGNGNLGWAMGADRFWVSLSRKSGDLAPGATVDVTVRLNSRALNLPVGLHVSRIDFINLETLDSDSRQVSLNIGVPGPATVEKQVVDLQNQYQVTLTGVPGTSYDLQQAPFVNGPWGSVRTGTFAGMEAVFGFSSEGTDAGFFRTISSGVGALPSVLHIGQARSEDSSLVKVTGVPYGVYVLESSLDGNTWVAIHTNKLSASGEYIYQNTLVSPNDPVQYRALAAGELILPTAHHVLIAGESLAAGFDGRPVLSTTPSPVNLRFTSLSSGNYLNPLAEIGNETIASGAASQVTYEAPLEPLVVSNIGRNGAHYESQKKGTDLYALGMQQFREAPQEVAYQLHLYAPRAIFVMMGEGDFLNADFGLNVDGWQRDYESDIQAATGYSNPIPMFHSQSSSWTDVFFSGGQSVVESPFRLLEEAEANPTKTILVGPRYFLPYGAADALFPGIHPTSEGYRWLGEYYGKVYKKVIVDQAAWSPLKPSSMVRAGNVITATFDVPEPPLVLDTTLVSNPGNYGFEFYDDSGNPPAIVSVLMTGPTSLAITLSSVPTGGNQRLRYAYSAPLGSPAGPTSGPRGNLRDSDGAISAQGKTLYNWCVHFDKPVL